jgi:hypothetical protein
VALHHIIIMQTLGNMGNMMIIIIITCKLCIAAIGLQAAQVAAVFVPERIADAPWQTQHPHAQLLPCSTTMFYHYYMWCLGQKGKAYCMTNACTWGTSTMLGARQGHVMCRELNAEQNIAALSCC